MNKFGETEGCYLLEDSYNYGGSASSVHCTTNI